MLTTEDVEVDFQLLWMDRRANAKSAAVIMGDTGPLFDAFGQPALKLTAQDELKALKELTRNRSFGPRYAITVARVRLLKQALGIRSLPIPAPADFSVKVVAWEDQLTARDRIEAAGGDVAYLFGKEADIEPVQGAAAADIAHQAELTPESSEQEAVAVAREERAADDDQRPEDEVKGEATGTAQPTEEERQAILAAEYAEAGEAPAAVTPLTGRVLDDDEPAPEAGEQESAPWAG